MGMTEFGFHLTAGGNSLGVEKVVEAETLAEAIALAEADTPGFRVVRGRALTNYDAGSGRVDRALEEFKRERDDRA